MRLSKRKVVLATTLVVALLAPAACGSGDDESSGGGADTGSSAAPDALKQVEGLDLEARDAKLTELAKAAGTTELHLYTSCSDCDNLFKDFTAKTGIKVTIYSADDSDVMQRITAGAKANRLDADLVMLASNDMELLHQQKLLVEYTTPVSDQIIPEAVNPYYIGMSLSTSGGCWNTKNVPNGPGVTWEEVLKNPGKIKLAFEIRQVEWFQGVVAWLEKDRGYTEDSALQLFRDAAKGAGKVSGGSLLAGNIATGLYDEAVPGGRNFCRREAEKGAPVGYAPMINPAVGRPLGPGIMSTSKNLAANLLAVDYMLSPDTQAKYCVETGRNATAKDAPDDCKLPSDTQLVMSDDTVFSSAEQTKHWTDLYAEVLGK